MPVGTVSLRALTSGRDCAEATASDVLGVSDRFEVVGADASTVPACMVEFESGGDRSDEQRVDESVCRRAPSVVADVPVSLWVARSHPCPTALRPYPDFGSDARWKIVGTVHAMNPNSIGGQ